MARDPFVFSWSDVYFKLVEYFFRVFLLIGRESSGLVDLSSLLSYPRAEPPGLLFFVLTDKGPLNTNDV